MLEAAELLRAAVAAEYVMLGGGNVRFFTELPPRIRRGHNDRAFEGGFRVWADERRARHWKALHEHAALWGRRCTLRTVPIPRAGLPARHLADPSRLFDRGPDAPRASR